MYGMDWPSHSRHLDSYIPSVITVGTNEFAVHALADVFPQRYHDVDRHPPASLINPRQDYFFLLASLALHQILEVDGQRQIYPGFTIDLGAYGAAYYPHEHAWYIEDCTIKVPDIGPSASTAPPDPDAHLRTVWTGFEDVLRDLVSTERIITPDRRFGSDYTDLEWRRFLSSLDYQQMVPHFFGKVVAYPQTR